MCDLWDQKVFFKISSIRTKDSFIKNKLVPIVTSGESFKYHLLLAEMDNEAHKAKLQSSLSLRCLFILMLFLFYLKTKCFSISVSPFQKYLESSQ